MKLIQVSVVKNCQFRYEIQVEFFGITKKLTFWFATGLVVLFTSGSSFIIESTVSANKSCPADQWDCGDGTCIPLAWKCDGAPDCPNKKDEECGKLSLICIYLVPIGVITFHNLQYIST